MKAARLINFKLLEATFYHNMVQWVEFHPLNISSIGITTKSIEGPNKPLVCHNGDSMWTRTNLKRNSYYTLLRMYVPISKSYSLTSPEWSLMCHNFHTEIHIKPLLIMYIESLKSSSLEHPQRNHKDVTKI